MSIPLDPGALGGLMSGFKQRMDSLKAEAAAEEVTGSAGGGLVSVTANGGLEVVRVTVSPEAAADTELLEDLVVAATNDALRQARGILEGKMSSLLGGLPIPPGMLGL